MKDHIAAIIWWLISVIPLGLGALGVLEGYLYWTDQPRITAYVRVWASTNATIATAIGIAFLMAVAVGFTHFILDR